MSETKAPLLNLARRNLAPETVKRRRTALVSLSLVLTLFALAGGHIKQEVTWLNLPLSFDRPWVLLAAAWIMWFYFLYRYLLVAPAPFKEFSEEVWIRVMNDDRVRKMAREAFDRAPIPDKARAQELSHIEQGWRYGICRHEDGYCFTTNRIYHPAKQASPSATTNYGLVPLTARETWTLRYAYVSATIKATALESTFSDDLLPLFLVLTAHIVWTVFYWQVLVRWLIRWAS